MANAGVYLCVVRNDEHLPIVVHNSIRRNDEAGQEEVMALAWKLFRSAKGRVPFAVAEIHLSPATQPVPAFRREYLEALGHDV